MKSIQNLLFEKLTPGRFRLLLAMMVMIYHTVDFISLGHYAVYVFFILSGYWIFKMYSEKYAYYQHSYMVYIGSRLARLMPMYWFILILSIGVYLMIPSLAARISNLKGDIAPTGICNLLILGIANRDFTFIGTAWSLDVEIQFYIIAPLLVLLFRNRLALIVLVISSLLALMLVYLEYQPINLLIYLPYFAIGGCIYTYNYTASQKAAITSLAVLAAVLVSFYAVPVLRTQYLLGRDTIIFGFNAREAINVLLALLTIPFVSLNVRQVTKKESAQSEQLLSSMSYVIYLLHWPLLQLYALAATGAGAMKKSALLLIYYIICISGSYFLSRTVDAFFEKKRKRWLGDQRKKVIGVRVEGGVG